MNYVFHCIDNIYRSQIFKPPPHPLYNENNPIHEYIKTINFFAIKQKDSKQCRESFTKKQTKKKQKKNKKGTKQKRSSRNPRPRYVNPTSLSKEELETLKKQREDYKTTWEKANVC